MKRVVRSIATAAALLPALAGSSQAVRAASDHSIRAFSITT
ncbi:MAG TPA: hypothetical protein VJM31_16130 [Vicinamibacterales bacterium]|nr:hypothetical protein [Vicinamibacterales bacterium]